MGVFTARPRFSIHNWLVFARRAISILTYGCYLMHCRLSSSVGRRLIWFSVWSGEFLSVRLTSSGDCFCFASSVPIISWCCVSEVGSQPFAAFLLTTANSDILWCYSELFPAIFQFLLVGNLSPALSLFLFHCFQPAISLRAVSGLRFLFVCRKISLEATAASREFAPVYAGAH
jgi:hypothetical protein